MTSFSKTAFAALAASFITTNAFAAQSILGYSCEGSSIDIEMEETVSGSPTVSVDGTVLTGGTTTTSGNDISIASVTSSLACPATSNVRVTLGNNIYTFRAD